MSFAVARFSEDLPSPASESSMLELCPGTASSMIRPLLLSKLIVTFLKEPPASTLHTDAFLKKGENAWRSARSSLLYALGSGYGATSSVMICTLDNIIQ